MAIYLVSNGPVQSPAAAMSVLPTGTSIKTMLQVKPGTTTPLWICEWGVSFDGSAAATPGKVELLETDVAATVVAFVANDITKLDAGAIAGGDPTTAIFSVGTSASGYQASAEGSITSIRYLDSPKLIAPTNQYEKQFPLAIWPMIQVSKFARIRITFATTVNMYCYMVLSTAGQ